MSDNQELERIIEEYVRTHVSFRPVKCETVGRSLRWTFAAVFHDKPLPPEDLSIYNTGDGVVSPSGRVGSP